MDSIRSIVGYISSKKFYFWTFILFIQLLLFTCLNYFSFSDNAISAKSNIGSFHSIKRSKLVLFLSVGRTSERNDLLKRQFDAVSTIDDVDCILTSYVPHHELPSWAKSQSRCSLTTIINNSFVEWLKEMVPVLVSNYQLFQIILDDVGMIEPEGNVDFSQYWNLILQEGFSVASPAVLGSDQWAMHRQIGSTGRITKFIEIQSVTFTPEAWECFYDLIDTEYPSGWGLDLWFYDYCKDKIHGEIAILDTFYAQHNPYALSSLNGKDVGGMMAGQENAWREERNITLSHSYSGKEDFIYFNSTHDPVSRTIGPRLNYEGKPIEKQK